MRFARPLIRCLSAVYSYECRWGTVLIVAICLLSCLAAVTAQADSGPPDNFLDRRVGVIVGMGFNELPITVRDFVAMNSFESAEQEQISEGQWIFRFKMTDKLARQRHEISILLRELPDAKTALLARVIFNEKEFNDRDRYSYALAISLAHEEKTSALRPKSLHPDQERSVAHQVKPDDDPDPSFVARVLHKRLAEVKRYPHEARQKRLEGRVILRVVITDTGEMDSIEVLQSSGHEVLDKSAIASVKMAFPLHFNRPPEKARVTVQVPIDYKLDR